MFGQWWTRRKIAEASRRFFDALDAGDAGAAIQGYERSIFAQNQTPVPPPVRAAFHLHRWMLHCAVEDRVALKNLASATRSPQVARAWRLLQCMEREQHVAACLQQRLPTAKLTAPLESEYPESRDLDTLAKAMLALLGAGGGTAATELERAENALRTLPLELPEATGPIAEARARVLAWACLTAGKFNRLVLSADALHALGEPLGRAVAVAAAFAECRRLVLANEQDTADKLIQFIRANGGVDRARRAVLACAREAIESGHWASATCWLAADGSGSMAQDAAGKAVVSFTGGLAVLKSGRFGEARALLANLADAQPNASQASLVRQIVYLMTLSLLAETADWPEAESADGEARRRDLLVQNRTLWNALQAKFDPLVGRLRNSDDPSSGDLLAGLVAYLTPSRALTMHDIEAFASAAERIRGDRVRSRLRSVEGALVMRAKATEEALRLIRSASPARLRDFHETVLCTGAAAVGPQVRTTVGLTVWNHFPDFDALPTIQQALHEAPGDGLIEQALTHVEAVEALRELARMCRRRSDEVLPSLRGVEILGEQAVQLAAVAATILHLRSGDLVAAGAALAPTPVDDPQSQQLRFRVAWQQGDIPVCQQLTRGPAAVELNPANVRIALWVRRLVHELAGGDHDAVMALLAERRDPTPDAWTHDLLGLTTWLLSRQNPTSARVLLDAIVAFTATDSGEATGSGESLPWAVAAASVFVAAGMRQYTACIEAADRLLAMSRPTAAVFAGDEGDDRVLDWARLLRIEAELAVAAGSEQDAAAQALSVQRSAAAYAVDTRNEPPICHYVFLIEGLVASLRDDSVVDEATVRRLRLAQQELRLDRRAAFLEGIVGRLQWRQRIVDEFWQRLTAGDFRQSWRVYRDELAPAFGDRMPGALQLGATMADYAVGAVEANEALSRLEAIQHQHGDLSRDIVTRARDIVLDGDKLRNLVRLLKEQRFHEIVETIGRTTWLDMGAGSMPVTVAVVKLYALYKLKDRDAARSMGHHIGSSEGLPVWVRDSGQMLLGYVRFEDGQYVQAADAFGKVREHRFLDHDIGSYQAACDFNTGLQLLAMDKRQEAFDAFSRSLSKQASAGTAKLAPLFIHFGLKGIHDRTGSRARLAFQLLGESLTEVEGPEALWYDLLADSGRLLCDCLIADDISGLGGEAFDKLRERLTAMDALPHPDLRAPLERSLHILAVCQELRRQLRQERDQRLHPRRLREQLDAHVTALKEFHEDDKPKDPVLLVLEGLLGLFLSDHASGADAALELLENALRLGVQSPRLSALVHRHRERIGERSKATRRILDRFDGYLAEGSVPKAVREAFIRDDDLAALYRLHQTHSPQDVLVEEFEGDLAAFRNRMENLREYLAGGGLEDQERFLEIACKIDSVLETLADSAETLLQLEADAMRRLAEYLRSQKLDGPNVAGAGTRGVDQ